MASIGHSAYGHEIVYDDTPISLHQADILDHLTREVAAGNTLGLTLQQLFLGRTRKTELIGLFLATLELIRQRKILVEQTDPLGDIRLLLRDEPPEPTLPAPPAAAADAPPATGDQPSTGVAKNPGGVAC